MTSGLSHRATGPGSDPSSDTLTVVMGTETQKRELRGLVPLQSPSHSPAACCQISAIGISESLQISQRASRILKSPQWVCDLGQVPSAFGVIWPKGTMVGLRHRMLVGDGALSRPGIAGCRDSKHLEPSTPPPTPTQGQMAGGRSGHGRQGPSDAPLGPRLPLSLLLFCCI